MIIFQFCTIRSSVRKPLTNFINPNLAIVLLFCYFDGVDIYAGNKDVLKSKSINFMEPPSIGLVFPSCKNINREISYL